MLIYLGCSAIVAFLLALGLALGGAAPAAVAHAAFALGALPLIFAAMAHFVPVLTRSRGAEAGVQRLPLALQLAGAAVSASLAGALPGFALHIAGGIALLAAALLLGWLVKRGRASFGTPHPGLAWYGAALACLILALLLILLGLAWPAGYAALRLAHLHLNTLGFIGLTALGTLHVLMPTVLGQPDSQVAQRLRQQLRWALAGVGLSATAAAGPWLAALGALLWGGVLAATLGGWLRTYGARRLAADGAALSLCGATLGLLGLIAAHGTGLLAGRAAVVGFFALFLLPLVTGALSQLLPVWRFAGPMTPARALMRARLVRFAALRTLLFLVGGALLAAGVGAGLAFLAVGLLLFAGGLAHGLAVRP